MMNRELVKLSAAACACAAMAGSPGQARADIKLGAISTLSGPGASPESVRGATAYLAAINATGGIGGHKIILVSEDDRADPQAAAAAANRLIADKGIVALAGGSSVLECAINHERYEKAGLMSIPGGGIDPTCFGTPNIVPVNTGPYTSLGVALSFAHSVLRRQSTCVVSPAFPSMTEAFQQTIDQWTASSWVPVPPMEVFTIGDPLGPIVDRVAKRGCQAVVFTGPNVVEWVHKARPSLPGLDFIFLTPAYTTMVARTLGPAGEGIYAMAEFEPWSGSSLQLSDWRHLMIGNNVPLSSLSQGGYLAATMIVKALRSIKGPVTRESATKALRDMAPAPNPLTAAPFHVGDKPRHNPNRSAIPMRLKEGRWRVAHTQWLTFDPR